MVLRVFSNLSDSMIPWQELCPCDCAHHRRARRGIWKQTLGWSVSSLGTKQPSDGEREVSASAPPSAWRSPGFYGQLQSGFWSSGGWHLPSEQYLVQNTCFCREDSAREPKEQLHIIALLSLFSYKRKPLHTGTQLLFQLEKKIPDAAEIKLWRKTSPFIFFDHIVLLFNRHLEMYCFKSEHSYESATGNKCHRKSTTGLEKSGKGKSVKSILIGTNLYLA